MRRDAGNVIKAFAVGPAVIVNKGLSEVKAITQGSARYAGCSRVNSINGSANIGISIEPPGFIAELIR